MKFSARYICIVIISLLTASGLAQSNYWCDGRVIPVRQLASTPLKIENLVFTSADEISFGHFTATNTKDRTIDSFLIGIEFVDKNNDHVLTMAGHNMNLHKFKDDTSDLKSWFYGQMSYAHKPIPSNQKTDIQLASTMATPRCPNSAKLSLVELKYSDGDFFRFIAPDITVDPVLLSAPLPDPAGFWQWNSLTAVADIEVDTNGHPRFLKSNIGAQFDELFQKQIAGWIFFPAMSKGRKVSSKLTLLFTIGDTDQDLQRLKLLKEHIVDQPVLSLRAVPPTSEKPEWLLIEAGNHYFKNGILN